MVLLDRSALRTKNGFSCFEMPGMEDLSWIKHAFLTRQGGVSLPPYHTLNWSGNNGDLEEHVTENRNRTAGMFNVDPARFLLLRQVHGDGVLVLKHPVGGFHAPLEYDAVMTDAPDLFLGILTADCLPILIVDKIRRVVAAVHAGRQGTALRLLTTVLRKMEEVFKSPPGDLLVSMGPCIGPCCYEIDEKVFRSEWKPFSVSSGKNKWRIDLAEINLSLLREAGITEDRISRVGLCTCCHADLFYSYRREGRTGRQLSFIGIVE
jgi:YfiH family protein